MGTVYRRDGKWAINVTSLGRRIRKVIGPDRNQALTALRRYEKIALEERLIDLETVTPVPTNVTPDITFREFVFEKLFPTIAPQRSPATNKTDRNRADILLRRWGHEVTICDLARERIESTLAELPVAPRTRNLYLIVLRRIFRAAVDWGYLKRNPCDGIPFAKHDTAPRRALAVGEVKRLLGAAHNQRTRVAISIMVYAGLRLGEVIRLRRDDVNCRAATVRILRSKGSKTPQGGRIAHTPLCASLVAILAEWLSTHKHGPVIAVRGGKPMMSGNLRRDVMKAGGRARIGHVTPHTLRHTFLTHAGRVADLWTVQQLARHKSITTTQRYVHRTSRDMLDAVNGLPY